jgi:hypothetical protein
LIVATQGRAIWSLDNISSLHQITPATTASAIQMYKPRDGYRTRVGAEYLSPTIEYFLPSVPTGPVKIDILDSAGKAFNSYNSDQVAAAGGRGGRGGAAPPAAGAAGAGAAAADAPDPEAGGGGGRGRGNAIASRVSKLEGVNRFVWDLRHSSGLTAPPARYQARITVGDVTKTVSFRVLIDPREAEDGTTSGDLREQFTHNMHMRELVTDVTAVVARTRTAITRLNGATGPAADTLSKLQAIADKLLTPSIRYSKPGLQSHITYLNGMTANGDQKVGRDAIERYGVLKSELEAIKVQLNRLLGPVM